MIEPNSFLCGDCLPILRELPDGFADLCLTDPPYGKKMDCRMSNNRKSNSPKYRKYRGVVYDNIKWDDIAPNKEVIKELERISVNQIIWGANYFVEAFRNPSTNSWVCWYKNAQSMANDNSDCELARTSHGKPMRFFQYDWCGFGFINAGEIKYHPTQKPIALFVWCLLNYSKPGDLIIDPFCGVGTTALAAHKTGRRFICIDKEPKYIEIAKKRYADLVAQQDLFMPEPETKIEQERLEI